jgi:hypothetical protein
MDDTTEEQQQRWMPESIFVFAGEGQEPIDIATYLIDDQDIFAALRNTKPRLEFPADLYPPVWSSRKVIESAVKNAVSEADNINLTVLRTMPKTDGVHPSTTLACDMARTYRVPKNANDIQANVYDSNREDLQRIDKLGVRLDHFVNKSQGNRKEGYDQPRRTYTKKPSPEQECPFRIRLMLDPGICWYLKPWSGCRCHLYHTKLPTSEKRRRMDTCTDKERSDAAIYAQQGSAGVAANIVREQTGNHFSHSQMRHNKINVELDSGQVPLPDPGELPGGGSSAEQCIRFLEKDGEKSHIKPFAGGFISQEIGLSQCQEDDNETSRKQNEDLRAIAMESSDVYLSCKSMYGIMCEQARLSNNPAIENIIRRGMEATKRKIQEELCSQQGEKQDMLAECSEYVSSNFEMDNRKTAKRFKSAGERTRRSPKGTRTPVRLDLGSLVARHT